MLLKKSHKYRLNALLCFICFYVWGYVSFAQEKQALVPKKKQEKQVKEDQDQYINVKDKKKQDLNVLHRTKTVSKVTRQQMDELIPRSTPEAIQLVPGVYVQQTAHGQASAFIRGRTGRHTLLLFDGFRISHSLFRNGPNQYLFSIDQDSLQSIDVIRGSAGVDWGANALAGAVQANPLEVKLDSNFKKMTITPLMMLRQSTADKGYGFRGQLSAQLTKNFGLIGGVGYRKLGLLEASGPLKLDLPPDYPLFKKEVPRFEKDGRTQMGTGYSMLTADLRARYRISAKEDLIIASYLTRQYDAPRTDQCPPPEAPSTWCLNYDEQFRTQVYSRLKLRPNQMLLKKIWAGVSFQRVHEKRSNFREQYINRGRDDLNIYEIKIRAQSKSIQGHDYLFKVKYGFDGSNERVNSKAWDIITRSNYTRQRSRGQYVDGGEYFQVGTWISPEFRWKNLILNVGARQHFTKVKSPQEEKSGTFAVDQQWLSKAFNAGLVWQLSADFNIKLSWDQGFSPPNLDDLTARQITGQGYQIENPNLKPEKSDTFEIGFEGTFGRFSSTLWLYYSFLKDLIEKRDTTCPPLEAGCLTSRRAKPFTLVNLDQTAYIYGFENVTRLKLPYFFTISHQMSYAYGEGISPVVMEREQGIYRPLSRIPPFNGQAQIRWDFPISSQKVFYINTEMRWATMQDRLSYGDGLDKRIPPKGTPGYQVYFMRFGLAEGNWSLNAVIENLTDTPYRIHGSSINGAARGFMFTLRYAPSY